MSAFFKITHMAALGAVLWLQYAMWLGDEADGRRRVQETRARVSELRHANEVMAVKNERLRASLAALQNDSAYTEAIARHEFNMIKIGEIFVMPAD